MCPVLIAEFGELCFQQSTFELKVFVQYVKGILQAITVGLSTRVLTY